MFERFTDRARRVVVQAQEEARTLGHSYVGTEHILLGLLSEGEGAGARVLTELGADLDEARRQVIRILEEYRRERGPQSGSNGKFASWQHVSDPRRACPRR
jgi:ATP-dependent Clp protease ATP-binding subunit ClpC